MSAKYGWGWVDFFSQQFSLDRANSNLSIHLSFANESTRQMARKYCRWNVNGATNSRRLRRYFNDDSEWSARFTPVLTMNALHIALSSSSLSSQKFHAPILLGWMKPYYLLGKMYRIIDINSDLKLIHFIAYLFFFLSSLFAALPLPLSINVYKYLCMSVCISLSVGEAAYLMTAKCCDTKSLLLCYRLPQWLLLHTQTFSHTRSRTGTHISKCSFP